MWKVNETDGRTDDGRRMVTIVHMSLRLRCTNKTINSRISWGYLNDSNIAYVVNYSSQAWKAKRRWLRSRHHADVSRSLMQYKLRPNIMVTELGIVLGFFVTYVHVTNNSISRFEAFRNFYLNSGYPTHSFITICWQTLCLSSMQIRDYSIFKDGPKTGAKTVYSSGACRGTDGEHTQEYPSSNGLKCPIFHHFWLNAHCQSSTRPPVARRGGIEVAGWTVDRKIRVRFPAYPHRVWATWWQGG